MRKIKLGDIFELETSKGSAFLHYIYHDAELGELVRVLYNMHFEFPNAFHQLAERPERFMVFFPLKVTHNRGIVKYVGNYSEIGFTKPRFMRTEHTVGGEFLGWHVIDTESWKRQLVKTLNPDQLSLSPWGIWNDVLLKESLENDWSLENWNR